MTAERWRRIERVFEAAPELPAEERLAFLDRACDGDPEVRREVEAMIAAGGNIGGAIESAIAEEATDLAVSGEAIVDGPALASVDSGWPATGSRTSGCSCTRKKPARRSGVHCRRSSWRR